MLWGLVHNKPIKSQLVPKTCWNFVYLYNLGTYTTCIFTCASLIPPAQNWLDVILHNECATFFFANSATLYNMNSTKNHHEYLVEHSLRVPPSLYAWLPSLLLYYSITVKGRRALFHLKLWKCLTNGLWHEAQTWLGNRSTFLWSNTKTAFYFLRHFFWVSYSVPKNYVKIWY